jgi:hypothetical protein
MRRALLASAAAIPDVRPQPQQNPDTVPEKIARSAARPREGAARQRQSRSRGARQDSEEDGGDEDDDSAGDDERSRRRRRREVDRDDGDGEEGEVGPDPADDGEPDALVSDPQVCREFGVSSMTLWRWDRDPDMNFPPRIVIGHRNYRSRKALERFKRRLLRDAVARRAREARG